MGLEVSVIIPTYNRADLIVPTLKSIVSQSYQPAEILVVDDGSTDNTEAVVRDFGSGVGYLRIENSGECRARNVGVAATSAPWIAFCDSDDLWHPNKLNLQVRLFENAPGTEYSFTNFRTVTDGYWSTGTKFDSSPRGYWDVPHRTIDKDLFIVEVPMFERLLKHQPIFPSTVMMSRSFFERVGRCNEPLGLTPSMDFEFALRCVTHPNIGVVSAPLVGIRKHASNFSGNILRTTMGEVEILRYVLRNHPAAKDYADAINEQIVLRSASAAEAAFAAGDMQRTRELLRAVPWRSRSLRQHLKAVIATAPRTLAEAMQRTAIAWREKGAH